MTYTVANDKPERTFGDIWKAFAFLFLPYLLGFIAISFTELRIWIALTKAIPAPPDETSSGNGSRSHRLRWHVVLAIAALLALCLLGFGLIFKSSLRQPIQGFSLAILYGGLFFVTGRFAYRICGFDKVVVHRTPDGGYMKRLHESNSNRQHFWIRILSIISAFLVVLGLSSPDDIISVGIVTTAIVYSVSGSSFGKFSIQRMMMFYVLILVSISAAITLQWFFYRRSEDKNTLWSSALSDNWSRFLFVPAALCSALSGGLIARMLRFDYKRHLDGPDHGQEIHLRAVPAPTVDSIFYKKEELVEGVLVPQWAPRAFLKPYYTLALVTWGFAHILAIGLHYEIGLPVSNPYLTCAIALLLEFPVIVVVLLLFAAIKREAKVLWNYRESWTLSLAGAISLPSDVNDDIVNM